MAEEDVLEVAEAEFEAVKDKVEDMKVKAVEAEGDSVVERLFEAIEVVRDRERFVIQGGSDSINFFAPEKSSQSTRCVKDAISDFSVLTSSFSGPPLGRPQLAPHRWLSMPPL